MTKQQIAILAALGLAVLCVLNFGYIRALKAQAQCAIMVTSERCSSDIPFIVQDVSEGSILRE